ncbi:MAG: serine/threonine protein phosphatase [Desulfovibrionaceae bacterium]|nr:serine/threonine protein phosphatase [Desulfovibrionaceae bacterium]
MNCSVRKGLALAVLCAALSAPLWGGSEACAAGTGPKSNVVTVYDRQAPVTEKELLAFLDVLPRFRAWAHENREEAHPVLRNGKADFLYSEQAAIWVKSQGWEPVRFFCVMGRMAAAMVIVEEGNDMRGTRPPDMPGVSQKELDLARRHMGAMLKAGGHAPPIRAE